MIARPGGDLGLGIAAALRRRGDLPGESGLAHAGVADDNDDTAAAFCGIIQGSRHCLQFSIATSKDWAEQRLH